MKKHLISLALLGLLAACASDKSKEAASGSNSARAPIENRSGSDSSTASSDNVVTHDLEPATSGSSGQSSGGSLNDPSSLLAKRSVYFCV